MPDYNYYPLPDQSLVRKLEQVIAEHPLYLKIRQQPSCHGPKLADFDAGEIERWQVSDAIKCGIYSRLGKRKGLVYALLYSTSNGGMSGLNGHGEMYDFLFHPKTHELLHVLEGIWMS